MKTITTTDELARFCGAAKDQPYVTIDTEFLRERTYYSKLCLIQMALPGKDGEAVLVDPLAEGLSLDPLYDLFRHEQTVKVFHAARQDLEIFFVEGKVFPKPLFDTQVAAMVCGFGEQVGYETLVKKIARENLDKSSRFTDWSRRPLSEAQQVYALADVTHLRVIYEFLSAELKRTGRQKWVEEEIAILVDPETYISRPEDAWEKVKTRTTSGRFLAVVRELARFREEYAQTRDVPRSRVYKDDALLELASTRPTSTEELGRSRLLLREGRKPEIADGILAAVKEGLEMKPEDMPKVVRAASPAEEAKQNALLAYYVNNISQSSFFQDGKAKASAMSEAEVAQMRGEREGRVTVALSHFATIALLPRVLPEFRRRRLFLPALEKPKMK